MSKRLPSGWVTTTLGEVCAINPHAPLVNDLPDDAEVSFVPMAAVEEETGRLNANQVRRVREVRRGYTHFQENDVLFAKITPCMENGKIALASGLKNGVGFGSTEFIVFRPHAGVLPRFILYFLLQPTLRQNAERQMTGASGQKRVPAVHLLQHEIWLPPTREQERIVSKLDAAFSKLERAELAARRSQDRLDTYKMSILQAGVTGALTRQWRKDNQSGDTGHKVLARFLAARQDQSKVARPHTRELFSPSEQNARANRTPVPQLPHMSVLPRLPKTWTWAALDMVAEIGSGISVSRNRSVKDPVELPYLRVANVMRGYLDLREIKTIRVEKAHIPRYLLHSNDILFNEGGDRDKLGRGWVWEGQLRKCLHQNHVFRARLFDTSLLNPKLVSHWGNTFGQSYFVEHGKQTTNLASINRGVLRRFPIPIAPVSEQVEIIRQITNQLASAERLAATVQRQIERTAATRHSLLAEAFKGDLVPHDPTDPHAAEILDRLRAIREQKGRRTKGKRMSQSKSKPMRRNLIDVLREHNKPITPEQLFEQAGFQPAQADLFYRELASQRALIEETRPSAAQNAGWPRSAGVLLHLKEG